jgi:hypothetical protein
VRTIIFTGAGAGKADGLPIQTELFREFFMRDVRGVQERQLQQDLAQFFSRVFSRDPVQNPAGPLPTFEEALGVLELAISRNEAILHVGEGDRLSGDLRPLRRQLILALAATISRGPSPTQSAHQQLVAALREASELENVTFITTNYDTLIDDALEAEAVAIGRGTGSVVDYGFGELVPQLEDEHSDEHSYPCYKIHGSLNWLNCPVCDTLDVTYASDGVTRLVTDPEAARCLVCETLRTPVIVPPSYYKDLSSVYLAVVWNKASRALQNADHVVFCGYSFADSDIHIKYLLKRAQLNRDAAVRPLRVTLVNYYDGKPGEVELVEKNRFERFLGRTHLVDSRLSFQTFAADPSSVLDRS